MTPEQAVQNIDSLIATSRLTRQEHIILEQSLKLLYETAKKYNNDDPELKKE
jgi:hypothetical protein